MTAHFQVSLVDSQLPKLLWHEQSTALKIRDAVLKISSIVGVFSASICISYLLFMVSQLLTLFSLGVSHNDPVSIEMVEVAESIPVYAEVAIWALIVCTASKLFLVSHEQKIRQNKLSAKLCLLSMDQLRGSLLQKGMSAQVEAVVQKELINRLSATPPVIPSDEGLNTREWIRLPRPSIDDMPPVTRRLYQCCTVIDKATNKGLFVLIVLLTLLTAVMLSGQISVGEIENFSASGIGNGILVTFWVSLLVFGIAQFWLMPRVVASSKRKYQERLKTLSYVQLMYLSKQRMHPQVHSLIRSEIISRSQVLSSSPQEARS